MSQSPKIRGDRLVLGLLSAFRSLVMELSRNGALDRDNFVATLEDIADTHRKMGDPNELADAIEAISEHIAAAPDLRKNRQ